MTEWTPLTPLMKMSAAFELSLRTAACAMRQRQTHHNMDCDARVCSRARTLRPLAWDLAADPVAILTRKWLKKTLVHY
jgi:hypothetical protein